MDAFDAAALSYAAVRDHPLGQRVAALFRLAGPLTAVGTGSVLLPPEVLSKPLRDAPPTRSGSWPGCFRG